MHLLTKITQSGNKAAVQATAATDSKRTSPTTYPTYASQRGKTPVRRNIVEDENMNIAAILVAKTLM